MNGYEHQSHERAAVAEAAELDVAMGRNTRTELLEGLEETTIEPAESAGPAGPEPPFDIHTLGGSGMAAAVLEQPAEAGDLEVAPETLFDAATAEGGQEVPHKAQMEAAFGRSFDDVTAFLGAEGPLGAMDAEAAARGNQLAFASKNPSPDKVAHELTHVEQFRKSGGGAAPIMASGAISDRGSASEVEAEQVSQVVAAGGAAPEITAAPDGGIQRSFLSFALKMGAKKASKGMLKNFIKTRIKDKIKDLANKKLLKEIAEEADQIMGILEDPWWVTAIGFIPIVGDAFDLYNVPKQIAAAIKRADQLEDKAKRAIDAQQAASSIWKKVVSWTSHGGKHVPNVKLPWAKIVESTKSGPAKYKPGIDIESFERRIWAEGTKVTNGKTWKVMEFPNEVGASGGKSSRWVRVEESGGTIHGHPIPYEEFLKLSR